MDIIDKLGRWEEYPAWALAGEAADEIERLRTLIERAADSKALAAENGRLQAEVEKLRGILDDEGYVKCPACGSYDTTAVPDANGDNTADCCKACGHGW